MTQQYKKFRDTLDEMFMLDHVKFNFGLYRIMNPNDSNIQELNKALNLLLYNTLNSVFVHIYVNGDYTRQKTKRKEEHWERILLEEEFISKIV